MHARQNVWPHCAEVCGFSNRLELQGFRRQRASPRERAGPWTRVLSTAAKAGAMAGPWTRALSTAAKAGAMAGPWTRVLSTAAEAAKAASREVMTPVENLLPWARAGREKDLRRVVVLGTGWGAGRVARDLDLGRHSSMALSIVSPR